MDHHHHNHHHGSSSMAEFANISTPISSWTEFIYLLHRDYSTNHKRTQLFLSFVEHHWHVTLYISVLYLVLIFGGARWMSNRQPYQLRLPLSLWSGSLAIFSLFGTIYLWPEMISTLWHKGLHGSFCDNSYKHDARLFFWYTLFMLSKVIELVDTGFIVLRKQKLIPLHWVHHVLTMCFTFYSYQDSVSTARYMTCLNLAVHTVMYGYYSLKACRVNISRSISKIITISQIAQMIFGLYMNIYVMVIKVFGDKDDKCQCSRRSSIAGFMLYTLFFYLFVRFFINSYLTPKKTTTTTQKVKFATKINGNGSLKGDVTVVNGNGNHHGSYHHNHNDSNNNTDIDYNNGKHYLNGNGNGNSNGNGWLAKSKEL